MSTLPAFSVPVPDSITRFVAACTWSTMSAPVLACTLTAPAVPVTLVSRVVPHVESATSLSAIALTPPSTFSPSFAVDDPMK